MDPTPEQIEAGARSLSGGQPPRHEDRLIARRVLRAAARVSPPTEPPEKHEANRWGLLVEHCDGNVCVNCCRCEKCGRKVGTRHLDACACPTDKPLPHWYCDDCSPPTERDERVGPHRPPEFGISRWVEATKRGYVGSYDEWKKQARADALTHEAEGLGLYAEDADVPMDPPAVSPPTEPNAGEVERLREAVREHLEEPEWDFYRMADPKVLDGERVCCNAHAYKYQRDAAIVRAEKAERENERHRKSHLVRAVLDGYGELDERITDYINTNFDKVPWEVAVKCSQHHERVLARAEKAEALLREAVKHGLSAENHAAAVALLAGIDKEGEL